MRACGAHRCAVSNKNHVEKRKVRVLHPTNADFSCQIPALHVNGTFVQPSVKLEKAIFRHIRLTRNFQNFELLEDGRKKLRIPIRLLQEKQRTSNKFSVRFPRTPHIV